MTAGRRLVGVAAVALLLASGCGDDTDASSSTAPADTGVTFPDTVPVPDGSATSTTQLPVADLSAAAPRGFPDDFPVPPDAEIQFGSEVVIGADEVLALDLVLEDDLAGVARFYREAIDDGGFALLFDDDELEGRPPTVNLRFEADDYVGDVLLRDIDGTLLIVLTATRPAD